MFEATLLFPKIQSSTITAVNIVSTATVSFAAQAADQSGLPAQTVVLIKFAKGK